MKPGMTRVSRSEWRFVGLVTIVMLIVTSLPYAYGYLSAPHDQVFMGLMLNVPDHGQYLAWWRGFQQALLIPNRLTPEPNSPAFFNLLWWTLGQLSSWTGIGYAPVYQGFRWVAGATFLWAAYRLIAQFLPGAATRRTAFLLTAFSSGLGWVLVVLKYTLTGGELLFPLDVYVAEGNSFLCILAYPHFTLAAAFIALTLEFFWRAWVTQRTRFAWMAGGLALLLGWMHAYDLLLLYGVIGAFGLAKTWQQRAIPWRLVKYGALVAVLSCSGAVYSLLLTSLDPLWREVLDQFSNALVYTPSPPHLMILFGFPLLGAVVVWIFQAWQRAWTEENTFVMTWFLAGALLNYVPADFQIHMLNSWQLPMMMLVAKGLHMFLVPVLATRWESTDRQMARLVVIVALLAVLPTNVYLWTWRFIDLARHDYPYYLHQDELEALDWLEQNAQSDDVVLSSLTIGQYVPALAGTRAFLAHWAQTVDFYDKEERVRRFFDVSVPTEPRLETVCSFSVDYVFHGPAERELGEYDPASASWLSPVFVTQETSVYQVKTDTPKTLLGTVGGQ